MKTPIIDFEEIRKQVSIKHNVLLGKDDPILTTVTINEMVLGRYVEIISEKTNESNQSLIKSLEHQVALSKKTAGEIITEAANYVSNQLHASVTDAVNAACIELKNQLAQSQAISVEALRSAQQAQAAQKIALLAAIVAGSAATIATVVLILALL